MDLYRVLGDIESSLPSSSTVSSVVRFSIFSSILMDTNTEHQATLWVGLQQQDDDSEDERDEKPDNQIV